jgi:hypothetical protein
MTETSSTPTDPAGAGPDPAPVGDPGRWLDLAEAAIYLRCSERSIQRHARPAAARFGGRTLYDRAKLDLLPEPIEPLED